MLIYWLCLLINDEEMSHGMWDGSITLSVSLGGVIPIGLLPEADLRTEHVVELIFLPKDSVDAFVGNEAVLLVEVEPRRISIDFVSQLHLFSLGKVRRRAL